MAVKYLLKHTNRVNCHDFVVQFKQKHLFLQSMLFVEVPSYQDASVCHSVKVNFYVINGKRKRSQPQHFSYTPLSCKNAAQPGLYYSVGVGNVQPL